MSTTPAFSPGPWITHGALVGSVRKWIFEDLYEQCSFHIAEKMPSSVKVGVRPISATARAYSSGFRPCETASFSSTLGSLSVKENVSLVRQEEKPRRDKPSEGGSQLSALPVTRASVRRPVRR